MSKFKERNRKVSQRRGTQWQRALRRAKLNEDSNPTFLKVTRSLKGLSQNEMASRLGLKTSSPYARIERSHQPIKGKMATKIAKALKARRKNLFTEIDNDKWIATKGSLNDKTKRRKRQRA